MFIESKLYQVTQRWRKEIWTLTQSRMWEVKISQAGADGKCLTLMNQVCWAGWANEGGLIREKWGGAGHIAQRWSICLVPRESPEFSTRRGKKRRGKEATKSKRGCSDLNVACPPKICLTWSPGWGWWYWEMVWTFKREPRAKVFRSLSTSRCSLKELKFSWLASQGGLL